MFFVTVLFFQVLDMFLPSSSLQTMEAVRLLAASGPSHIFEAHQLLRVAMECMVRLQAHYDFATFLLSLSVWLHVRFGDCTNHAYSMVVFMLVITAMNQYHSIINTSSWSSGWYKCHTPSKQH